MKLVKTLLLAILVFLCTFCFAYAQVGEDIAQQDTKVSGDDQSPEGIKSPDLVIDSVAFKAAPKQGQPISQLNIRVTNKGSADAAENKLLLKCVVLECARSNKCDSVSSSISGEIDVPMLTVGESVDLVWSPAKFALWAKGSYSIVTEVDSYKAVSESDEDNNINKTLINVNSFSTSDNGD